MIKEDNFTVQCQNSQHNDILMCSPHNESKSIFAESSIRTLKGKICKKITANDTKSYNSYLDKLVDKYNNTCIVFLLAKNVLKIIILLWLKKLSWVIKLLNLELVIESELLSTRVFSFVEHSTLWMLIAASDHLCFIYVALFSGLKMIFSKFTQLDITACIKNCVWNNYNLCCYFMSSLIERLYKSFSFLSSSVPISSLS